MSAAELGTCSVGELVALQQVWIDRERTWDLRFGMILSMLANINRDAAKSTPFHPADFFPSLEPFRPPPPTQEELERKIRAGLAAFKKG